MPSKNNRWKWRKFDFIDIPSGIKDTSMASWRKDAKKSQTLVYITLTQTKFNPRLVLKYS
jgi:hypothetical protein